MTYVSNATGGDGIVEPGARPMTRMLNSAAKGWISYLPSRWQWTNAGSPQSYSWFCFDIPIIDTNLLIYHLLVVGYY